jgi:hypothetical protein
MNTDDTKNIKDDMSQKLRMFYFVVYTIFYETLIWGLVALWLAQGWSAWILLLGVIMSGSQFQPRSFGLITFKKPPKKPEDMNEEEFKRWKEIQRIKNGKI